MSLIKNGSPEIITLGAKDLSTRQIPFESTPTPRHLPIFFLYTKKGPTTRKVVTGNQFNEIFGADSLESSSKYFNHQSKFFKGCIGYNASCMVQRIIPDDAGVRANFVLYLDVIKTNIVNYLRNSDGNMVPNKNSNDYELDITNPVIEGYKIKWVKEYITVNEAEKLGTFEPIPGTMTDDLGNQSTMYPILEVRASEKGSYYNNIGIAIGSFYGDELDESIKDATGSMPFKLYIYTREDEETSPAQFNNLYDEPYCVVSLKQKAVNPNTEELIDIDTQFKNKWFNTKDTSLPYKENLFNGLYVYRKNYEKLTKMFMELERKHVTSKESVWADNKKSSTVSWYDFTTIDQNELLDQGYMLNLFSGMTSKKVKYITIQFDSAITSSTKTRREINMGSEAPIFLEGGTDGTLNNKNFEKVVIREMKKYSDPNSEYQDLAINVENILWDSGFTLDCKKELCNFIAVRKDTVLVLSVHDAELGTDYYSLSESRSRGVALNTRLRLFPESTYYGTPVARAMVVIPTYTIRDDNTGDRTSLAYDIMIKAARMMGAANGKWNTNYKFDRVYGTDDNPGSLITSGTNIEPQYIPSNVKPNLWANGLIWAQPFDLNSYHFPALQTVYKDDTSILNSFFTLMALSTVTKISAEAWRTFTGTQGLTDGEFTNMVSEWLRNATSVRNTS